MWVGEKKPGIGYEPRPGQKKEHFSQFPPASGEAQPAWIAYDKRVLSFNGFFEEVVINNNSEAFRIRPVKVYFYLEDDTIQVNEPLIENSGLSQGCFIRRHRVPLPNNSDKFFTCEQFNVGATLPLYGKSIHLCSCDKFTHNFLTSMGVTVGQATEIPVDGNTIRRMEEMSLMQPLRPYQKIDTFGQFLERDRMVLRFYGQWDDRDNSFGDVKVHDLTLHYYLADDTIEVLEKIKANSGRDNVPVFLHRGKLLRNSPVPAYMPGAKTPRTVLNVCNTHHILDGRKTGELVEQFYTEKDLQVGHVINVHGRPLKLHSCDEFTKKFYETNYDVTEFGPEQPIPEKKSSYTAERVLPPYNGFGIYEDTVQNCKSLLPQPPKKDVLKFMKLDRDGLNSHVLRFVARIRTNDKTQQSRKFVISYFLYDTVQVFEPPIRNSGISGGKFCERMRMATPGQDKFSGASRNFYSLEDFYVGAEICVKGTAFELTGADAYALDWMSKNGHPCSSIAKIEAKIQAGLVGQKAAEIKSQLSSRANSDGTINFESMRSILEELGLNQQEILTLGRHFASSTDDDSTVTRVARVVKDKLRRRRFDEFSQLSSTLSYHDRECSGRLPRHLLERVIKSFKLPILADEMNVLLGPDAEATVDYKEFLRCIDYTKSHEAPPTNDDLAPTAPLVVDLPPIGAVNYAELFSKLSI
ncbi:unnamed protein product [Oikopleura dioica]|uniref:EF-hand domain-containing family member C2 n=1 Tax=Oikopleura dioica TaxID=34765 RepID=E4XEN8_OIKDI|nr:unnamed protein product [Oikopleura dioica]